MDLISNATEKLGFPHKINSSFFLAFSFFLLKTGKISGTNGAMIFYISEGMKSVLIYEKHSKKLSNIWKYFNGKGTYLYILSGIL